MHGKHRDRRREERAGRVAEWMAIFYLALTGHRILARRWRGRAGEIDLVARRRPGRALEWRFDLIRVSLPGRASPVPLRHLKDAWRCDG